MTHKMPNRVPGRQRTSLNRVLQELAPDVAALAAFAFRESRRRRWLPADSSLESWLLSAICERADLVVQYGILRGEESERFSFFVRPILIEDGLTVYFEA